MREARDGWTAVLAGVVIGHLVVALAHGAVHRRAGISLSLAGNLFVLLVVIAGPLLGLVWSRMSHSSAGAWPHETCP